MDNAGKVIAGFLAGAAAGASLGLILAPEKGEMTRKKIKEAMDEWSEKASEQYGKYKEAFQQKKD